MACCACCLAENGHNIALEIFVIVIAPILLIAQIALTASTYLLLSNVILIVASVLGIVALKQQHNYRLGWVTFGLSCIAFAVLLVIWTFVAITIVIYTRGTDYESVGTGVITFAFIYIFFGLGSSLSLAMKHFKICRVRRQNELNTQTVVVGTTVQYVQPEAGQLIATAYESVDIPQEQPPPYDKNEKHFPN